MEDFWDTKYLSEEYRKRKDLVENFVQKFYDKIQHEPNVLSGSEVFEQHQNPSFFSKSFWNNKSFLQFSKTETNKMFGLKSGILFKSNTIYFMTGRQSFDYFHIDYKELPKIKYLENGDLTLTIYDENRRIFNYVFKKDHIEQKIGVNKAEIKDSTKEDIKIIKEFISELNNLMRTYILKINEDLKTNLEKKRQELITLKNKTIKEFDINLSGKVNLTENDFNKLLNNNQKLILNIDRNYIHKFVKVSNYIKTKNQNIQSFFLSIKKLDSKSQIEEASKLLKDQIHTYDLLIFHSINMITSLVSDDMITFYEIYESFDKVGIFNSNWENEVSEKLSNIGEKLSDLLYSIYQMENRIVNEISNLSYITQSSFQDLRESTSKQLNEINSSIKFNNLLAGIQTYQMYKINKRLD